MRQPAHLLRLLRSALAGGALTLALFAAACGAFGDGGSTPKTLDDADREQIAQAIEGWVGALNSSDFTTAQLYSLTPDEVGSIAIDRLFVEVGAYTTEGIAYEFRGLLSAQVEGDAVAASFDTDFGPRHAQLVRQEGAWKLQRFPRMLVPNEEGPVNIRVHVLGQTERSPGEISWFVEFTNDGDQPVLYQSAWALIFGADGSDRLVAPSTVETRGFLPPGESTLVRIDAYTSEPLQDPAVEFVAIARPASAADGRNIVDVDVEDVDLEEEGSEARPAITGRISNPELSRVLVSATAAVYGTDGRLLALEPWTEGGELAPGGQADVRVVIPSRWDVGDAESARLFVFAKLAQPQ